MTDEMQLVKSSECPSLSGKSTLTYNIIKNDEDMYLLITGNTGAGKFPNVPVSLNDIESALKNDQPITSGTLARASFLQNKSTNLAGFLLAALLHEGMVVITEDKDRKYKMVEQAKYDKIVQGYTKKRTGKKTKGVTP